MQGSGPPRIARGDLLALLALLVLIVCLFPEALLSGRAFFERDVFAVWLAQVEAFRRAVRAGVWPLWDDTLSFGQPLLANPNAQVLYPTTWLALALPPWTVYSLSVVGHMLLGGLGVYALARHLGVAREGAGAAACLWLGCGPLLSLVDVWHHLAGAAWMPWVLLGAEATVARPRARTAVLWGLAMAMQVFAGSPDFCVMTGVAIGARLVTVLVGGRDRRRVCLLAALAMAIGSCVSAPQWLTTLEAVSRADPFWRERGLRVLWSLHPASLVQLLLPVRFDVLGARGSPESALRLSDVWNPFLRSFHVGLVALALAAVGVAAGGGRRALFLSALLAFGLLYALGPHTPFYDLAVAALPPLRLLRYPSKATVPVALALCLLAGLGVHAAAASQRVSRLLSLVLATATFVAGGAWIVALGGAPFLTARPHPEAPPWSELLEANAGALGLGFAISAAALAVSLLGASRRRSWAPSGVALLGVAGLAAEGRGINSTVDTSFFRYRPEILEVVGEARRLYVWDYVLRVAGRSHPIEDAQVLLRTRPQGRWPQKVADALGFTTYLYPPIAGRFGLRGSFERDLLGLYPRGLSEMTKALRAVEDTPGFLRLLQIGAVDFVVALHAEGQEELLGAGQRLPSPFARPIFVFRVPGTRPRAYAVGSAIRVDGDAAFTRLLDPAFDPSCEVVLSDGGAVRSAPGFTGAAGIVEERPGRVTIEAELGAPGYLVYVATHDPGWRARVDGRDAAVVRANGLFLAVATDAGRHRVELAYAPRAIGFSLALALAGCAVAIFSCARPRGPGATESAAS